MAQSTGYLLILNYTEFTERSQNRYDTEQDVTRLRHCFERLEFIVDVKINLKKDKTVKVLSDLAKDTTGQLGRCASLWIVLMTHGWGSEFDTSNGTLNFDEHVLKHFTNQNCPRLAGKPKIICYFPCRGGDKQDIALTDCARPASTVFSAGATSAANTTSASLPLPTRAPLMDTLVIYAIRKDL